MKKMPNYSLEPTRTSRSDHCECSSHWRLVRAAHSARSPMPAILLVTLIMWLPVRVSAEGLPYETAKAMLDAASCLNGVDGFRCELTMVHSRNEDKRPFKVFLESPVQRVVVEVHPDGAFRLPVVPRQDWENTSLVHTLEPGALSLNLFFGFESKLLPSKPWELQLSVLTSNLTEKCEHFSALRDKLKNASPEIRNVEIAAIGISIPREKPNPGEVHLKRGGHIVASINLQQTGPAAWMFEQYDPKTHTISFDVKEDQPPIKYFLVLKAMAPGEPLPPNAFYFWKGEPGGAANRSQPLEPSPEPRPAAPGSSR